MKFVVALVALLLVAGSLLFWSQHRRPRQTVSGFVEEHEIRVGSRVGGRIEQLLVEEGDHVKAGQPLVKFAPFDLLERKAEAEATLAARTADLERLQHGFRPEEIAQAQAHRDQLAANLEMLVKGLREQEKEIAKAQVASAKAALILAQQKFKRTNEIARQGQATAEEVEAATQQLRNAEAQLVVRQQEELLAEEGTRIEEINEAKARLAEAQAAWQLQKNGYRKEEIEAAKAAADGARAALGTIGQQIDELVIKSPVNGTIEALDLRRGDLVPANAPVLSLLETGTLWIRAYIPETRQLKVGQVLPVTLDSFPGRRFKGEVTFVSAKAEFTPRNVQTIEERSKQVFRIKVTLLDGLDEIRPGMIGDVWLEGN